MENNTNECKFFWLGILIVLLVFLVWPGIIMLLADVTAPAESKLHGITKDQYAMYSQIYTCLGSLFAGMAFLGTYLLIRSSNAQKQQLEKQVSLQKVQSRIDLYRQMIDTVHRYKSKIQPEYEKDKVCEAFSKTVELIIQDMSYILPDSEQTTQDALKNQESYFFNMRKQWHATCCLFKNVVDIIRKDLSLEADTRNYLLKYLHSMFSPMDEIAMAIFYYSIKMDVFTLNMIDDAYIFNEYNSFDAFAKSRISNVPRNEHEQQCASVDEILKKLISIIQINNLLTTDSDSIPAW